jgi:hypothetical protein
MERACWIGIAMLCFACKSTVRSRIYTGGVNATASIWRCIELDADERDYRWGEILKENRDNAVQRYL